MLGGLEEEEARVGEWERRVKKRRAGTEIGRRGCIIVVVLIRLVVVRWCEGALEARVFGRLVRMRKIYPRVKNGVLNEN